MSKQELKPTYQQKLYCSHKHPFAYAACTTFGNGFGLLQIHSDWGTYSYMWNAIGKDTLEEFVVGCNYDYIYNKLLYTLRYMGLAKEAEDRCAQFIIKCWPNLVEVIKEHMND